MNRYHTKSDIPKISFKKSQRRKKLCQSRKLSFEMKDIVEIHNMDDLTIWCHNELNGAFHWFSFPHLWFNSDELFIIGFQDDTDRLAFALRWLKNYEVC